jgi:hypothetical protein
MGLGLGISPIINQSITLLPGHLMAIGLPSSQTTKDRTRYTSNPSCKLMFLKSGFSEKFVLLRDYEKVIIMNVVVQISLLIVYLI